MLNSKNNPKNIYITDLIITLINTQHIPNNTKYTLFIHRNKLKIYTLNSALKINSCRMVYIFQNYFKYYAN